MAAKGARRLDEFGSLFDDKAEHPFLLNQVKQIGFYTDCLGKAHWSLPMEVIDKAMATTLVKTADLLAQTKQVTETEIELWIKRMKPVWKGSRVQMEKALIQWYQEMQEKGLAEKGKNAMSEFILRGLSHEKKRNDEGIHRE